MGICKRIFLYLQKGNYRIMSNDKDTKKTAWTKNKPPQLTRVYGGMGLKPGEMLRGLKDFNRATFASDNKEVMSSLEWTHYVTELDKIGKDAYKFEKHAGYGRRYPGTPMIDKEFSLSDGELEALMKFKGKKPFKASKQEWLDMIQQLYLDLAKVQGHKAPAVLHTGIWEPREDFTSFYSPHIVVLTGQKSVVTALHEYTHSAGYGEVVAVWWSTNAFRIVFPRAFAKLEQHPTYPHLLRKIKRPKKKEEAVAECPTACEVTLKID